MKIDSGTPHTEIIITIAILQIKEEERTCPRTKPVICCCRCAYNVFGHFSPRSVYTQGVRAAFPPPIDTPLRLRPAASLSPLQNPTTSTPPVAMARRHPAATSAKRRAAPPNPSPTPPAADGSHPLLHAARRGDLRLFKRLVRDLDKGRGRHREVVDAAKEEGLGALHFAAGKGRLRVCRYLVEGLGVDVDAVDDAGRTPLLVALLRGIMDTASYLLDHGADPGKADDEGFAPLHHAATAGDRKMVELLLAKGVSVDPVCVDGTPLYAAAIEGHDEIMQILLENNADCNKKIPGIDTPLLVAITAPSVKCVKLLVEAGADVNDGILAPLVVAAEMKGSTACLKLLLEAGADPNVPDPSGRFPIELAAQRGTREGVEILFPVTCIPTVHDWSVDGIIQHARVSRKQAMEYDRHDATLLSDRSFCWLCLGDGHEALQDALACREMRPGWPNACYRQGEALMLLKDYGGACDAFLDAAKLDPGSPEIESALWKAMNSLKTSCGATQAV
ncbi:hypothetical protein VPH35_094529 [Triticum aestivum]